MLALIETALLAVAVGIGANTTPPSPTPVVVIPSPRPASQGGSYVLNAPQPPTREEYWQSVHGEPSTPSAPPAPRTTWYGGPAVVTDVVATVLGIVAAKRGNESLAALGALTYAVGPPINHLRLRRPGRALASWGMRALAALATAGAFYAADDANCYGDNPNAPATCGLVILPLIGLVATMIIDDAIVAREPASLEAQ